MNKKFLVALILPLLLIPLASFGYAHSQDYVEKKYKLYVGTLEANITAFHVDHFAMIDVDNDGDIMDDEIVINIFNQDCTWYVQILADPICGGFVLNTTMNITNTGDLPYQILWDTPKWDNQSTTDPCWATAPSKLITSLPEPWSWDIKYYKINATAKYPVASTTEYYKPGDVFQVVQHINFEQPADITIQKQWEDQWVWIWEKWTFFNEDLVTGSSWTWPT